MKDQNGNASFAANLIKARTAAGFETAYKFYHRNGGRGHFPFTFFHYTRVEKGLTLPSPAAMRNIFIALRLLPTQGETRELLLSYLQGLLGGGRVAEDILNPLFGSAAETAQAPDSMRWMRQHAFVHMSPEEFMAVSGGEDSYWCAEALCSDQGAWTAAELAEKLALAETKVVKALAPLLKCGLIVKDRGGKYKCRYDEKFFIYPGRLEGMGKRLEAIKGYWEKAGGKQLFERQMVVRSDPGAMANFKLALAYAVDGSHAYATHTAAPGSAFYLVRTEIKELKKF
ncbi:MAG TPA: hypothetical protein PKI19_06755 [Elusimicrobiales bacterium]|nr:hypothetical protein [Elusimicrobiales bacterium]